MIWIPVAFVCVMNSSCGFVYDKPQFSERDCNKKLEIMRNDLGQRKEVSGLSTTCIPASTA